MRVGFAESDTRTAYRRHPTREFDRVTDEATISRGVDERLADRGMGELAEKMGMVITELTAERAVGTIPVEGNRQPIGLLHGGAYVVLAESLGSMAANVHAGPGRYAVGIELNASHSRSATSGLVTGTCTALHLGSTLTTHEIVLTDDQGRRCSTVRITNMIREAR
ncbi:hotdog fold thioesterase [Curtobacterium pusillum]|uniref:Hotdog fold thioesterase n=2 Tax=Curtobacterium pusillum TaxID=69373 RepID=A0ABX2M3S8_9MICO|nr:hotdog fold thioesterase [Curtobacterium pusillum]